MKFAALEVGFRHLRAGARFEVPVPPGEAPLLHRQIEAMRAGLPQVPGDATAYLALPGDGLTLRVLDMPFADPRKIEQVVAYELEGQMVHALADVVFDHTVVAMGENRAAAVVAAARQDELREILGAVQAAGLEPRALYAAPLIYRALLPARRAPDDGAAGCHLLIDVGHERTNLCFLRGRDVLFARTVARGGRDLTRALAAAFRSTEAEAEDVKRRHGFVAAGGQAARTPAAERVDAILRPALGALVRDVRQTLASFAARDRTPVDAVLLTGGGARVAGLPAYLEQELQRPVALWTPSVPGAKDTEPAEDGPPFEDDGRYAVALASAYAGARGGREIDLRRGPFQYRASFSLVRQKAAHLAALAASVIIAAGIFARTSYALVDREHARLQIAMKEATQELFGQPRDDAAAVASLLKKGFREEMAPIPKATAFDLLEQISQRLPSAERIKLDVQELDIRPKKTFIKGTVDSAAAVDEIVARLREVECFEDITKGSITEVTGGAKQFTLTIASRCP